LGDNSGRIQKQDLLAICEKHGAILGPQVSIRNIKSSISQVSGIGKKWKRDIGGKSLNNPYLDDVLSVIDEGISSILITGGPGSGKTCLLLDLFDELEKSSLTDQNLLPLFIQSSVFSNCNTLQEVESYGFPVNFIQKVSRLSEKVKVIIIIDSLDVLSISREHNIFSFFWQQ